MIENEVKSYTKLIKRILFPKVNQILVPNGYPKLLDVDVIADDDEDSPITSYGKNKMFVNVYLEEGDMSAGSEEMDDIFPPISHMILNIGDYVFTKDFHISIKYFDIYREDSDEVFFFTLTSRGLRYPDSQSMDHLKNIIKEYKGIDYTES